jgi:hypothetical protein
MKGDSTTCKATLNLLRCALEITEFPCGCSFDSKVTYPIPFALAFDAAHHCVLKADEHGFAIRDEEVLGEREKCPNCSGSGRCDTCGGDCSRCDGDGYIHELVKTGARIAAVTFPQRTEIGSVTVHRVIAYTPVGLFDYHITPICVAQNATLRLDLLKVD